jgi:hypothetical protein
LPECIDSDGFVYWKNKIQKRCQKIRAGLGPRAGFMVQYTEIKVVKIVDKKFGERNDREWERFPLENNET